jgi:peptidyl-dipeptidase Dcp
MLDLFKNNELFDQAVPFNQINSQDFPLAIDDAIKITRERIQKIENENEPTFENTVEALELASLEMDQITTVFFNLYHACTDPHIDEAVTEISQKLAQLSNDIQLSEPLFKNVKKVFDQQSSANLNKEQTKLLKECYESFTRNGALLGPEDKNQLREIDQQMAQLSPQYSQNVLKATHAYRLNIQKKSQVEALPESVKETARKEAEKRGESGWTFTLQAPSYMPFMKSMQDRSLREQMWRAFNSKALDGEFSNRKICQQIAELRNRRAKLLGAPTHAHFVLQKRMAQTPDEVFRFLEQLKEPSLTQARKDLKSLTQYVQTELKEDIEIQPWDFSFYSEKYKKHLFDLNDEDLRPYFPLEQVIKGIFIHGEKLYGLKFEEDSKLQVYHDDVKVYRVTKGTQDIGLLYLDMFPRENKKSGAWMTNYREQGFDGRQKRRPHVSIVCNFSPPTENKPSLLTFYEVQTLFHEFGHSLHSLLSDCYYSSLAGTNVLWDFVELPSQLMENWTYEKESLDLFAQHYETGERIPEELVEKLSQSRNFNSGYGSLRQIGFSLVDMYWHSNIEEKDLDPVAVEDQATRDVQLLPKIPGTNFSVSFSHIFAGGYSAGYYSYKWAEVLDADAFEAFKEEGLFDPQVANRFYTHILSRGGVEDPAVLYKNFRGQEPDPKALLRRSGWIESL